MDQGHTLGGGGLQNLLEGIQHFPNNKLFDYCQPGFKIHVFGHKSELMYFEM